jgi:hypothetical protein
VENQTVGNKIVFQHYLVAYLDLLGLRDSLRKWPSEIPTTPAEKVAFCEIARNDLGKLLKMRKAFTDFFNGAKSRIPDLSPYPSEYHEIIRAARQVECNMYYLSDAIVITVPLDDESEYCKAINGVEFTFLAVCGLAVYAFEHGFPFRGGLDIGIANLIDVSGCPIITCDAGVSPAQAAGTTEPENFKDILGQTINEVFGSAFMRAYDLEDYCAEYPRFIIGNELFKYIEFVSKQDPSKKDPQTISLRSYAKQIAAGCRSMIVQDTDGRQMLDFLGTKVKELLGASLSCKSVEKALDFVQGEYRKFHNAGNEKLAPRYFRLLQYFLSRKKMWGLA